MVPELRSSVSTSASSVVADDDHEGHDDDRDDGDGGDEEYHRCSSGDLKGGLVVFFQGFGNFPGNTR